jgi:hypothetical protein
MPHSTPVIHDNLALLETADAAGLDHLLADVTVGDGVVARLSPTVAAIDPTKLEAVIARLRKIGQWPKVI